MLLRCPCNTGCLAVVEATWPEKLRQGSWAVAGHWKPSREVVKNRRWAAVASVRWRAEAGRPKTAENGPKMVVVAVGPERSVEENVVADGPAEMGWNGVVGRRCNLAKVMAQCWRKKVLQVDLVH